MTYVGDGEISAGLASAAEQPVVATGRMTATVVADMDMTEGRYSLYLLQLSEPGIGASPHFHRTFAESFHVLAGTVELYDGATWSTAGPRDHLYVPPGGIHAFRQVGEDPVDMLMLSCPGIRREDYFAELQEIRRGGAPLSAEEWVALFARHDQYMV